MKAMIQLFLLFCAVISGTSHTQAQILVREGLQWNQAGEDFMGNLFYTFAKFQGTTTIHDTSYFVLKTSDNLSDLPWQNGGYYRQEGAQVYKRWANDPEYLLYDFSLVENDTITLFLYQSGYAEGNTFFVKSVDSLQMENGIKRKHLILQHTEKSYCLLEWVEGIGDLRGITEEGLAACFVDNLSYIVCFYEDNTLQYYFSGNPCAPNNAIEVPQILKIEIFPNPANDQFTIKDELYFMASYRLLDAEGKEWASGLMNPPLTHIDVPQLPNGTFYLHLKDWNEKVHVFSVMKF